MRVRGKGLVVRARKGYYAPSDAATASRSADKGPPGGDFKDPDLQRVLDAPGAADAIPLRMSAYALQASTPDTAQVVIAADADVAKIAFPEGGGNAVLDTLVAVAHRESGGVHRADRRVELQRRASAPAPGQAAWYSFLRDFALPAGGYQAKLVVRDVVAQRIGSVILDSIAAAGLRCRPHTSTRFRPAPTARRRGARPPTWGPASTSPTCSGGGTQHAGVRRATRLRRTGPLGQTRFAPSADVGALSRSSPMAGPGLGWS